MLHVWIPGDADANHWAFWLRGLTSGFSGHFSPQFFFFLLSFLLIMLGLDSLLRNCLIVIRRGKWSSILCPLSDGAGTLHRGGALKTGDTFMQVI